MYSFWKGEGSTSRLLPQKLPLLELLGGRVDADGDVADDAVLGVLAVHGDDHEGGVPAVAALAREDGVDVVGGAVDLVVGRVGLERHQPLAQVLRQEQLPRRERRRRRDRPVAPDHVVLVHLHVDVDRPLHVEPRHDPRELCDALVVRGPL